MLDFFRCFLFILLYFSFYGKSLVSQSRNARICLFPAGLFGGLSQGLPGRRAAYAGSLFF